MSALPPITLRTMRAVVLTACIWGIAWALVGVLIGVVEFIRVPPETFDLFDLRYTVLKPMRGMGVAGVLAGATFAAVVARLERGASLALLSLGRVAMWGAVGGLGFAMLLGALILGDVRFGVEFVLRATVWTTALAACGAFSAAGSLAIARQGTPGLLEEVAALQRLDRS